MRIIAQGHESCPPHRPRSLQGRRPHERLALPAPHYPAHLNMNSTSSHRTRVTHWSHGTHNSTTSPHCLGHPLCAGRALPCQPVMIPFSLLHSTSHPRTPTTHRSSLTHTHKDTTLHQLPLYTTINQTSLSSLRPLDTCPGGTRTHSVIPNAGLQTHNPGNSTCKQC